MEITHLFAGKPEHHSWNDQSYNTAIFKKSIASAIIDSDGLLNDEVGDKKHHGGIYKAVYAYSTDFYSWWREQLPANIELPIGAFGENLSVSGLDEENICLGDTFRCGDVVLRASEPRMPCMALAMRLQYKDIIKEFTASRKFGVYFKVEHGGEVNVGAPFILEDKDPAGISIARLGALMGGHPEKEETLNSWLKHPHASPYIVKKINSKLND